MILEPARLDPRSTFVEGLDHSRHFAWRWLRALWSRAGPPLTDELVGRERCSAVVLLLQVIHAARHLKAIVRWQVVVVVGQLVGLRKVQGFVGLQFVEPRQPAVWQFGTLQIRQRPRNWLQILAVPGFDVDAQQRSDQPLRLPARNGGGLELSRPDRVHLKVVLLRHAGCGSGI